MKVLVACEFSGVVRDAFLARGHEAISCDILPTESPDGPHYHGDVRNVLAAGIDFDLMICHPPCTHLSVSGAKHFREKRELGLQQAALDFVRLLLNAPIPRIALENPISVISSEIRKPDQIIQPWMFGDSENKATCLWLKNLPPLQPLYPKPQGYEVDRIFQMTPSKTRAMDRSRTFPGIARAMAEQWGSL